MRHIAAVVLVAMFACVSGPARAQTPEETLASLNFQTGSITLGDNLATVAQTPNFAYLSPADSQTLLTKVWGNPPGSGADVFGMILPVDDDWGIVVTYDDDGHVSDEDASEIDYGELLADMQEGTRADSEERVKQGYESIELVGWAKPPYYDAQTKKLYWAKRLKFGGAPADTLNYSIRVLGRAGTLQLNIVGGIDELATIDARVGEILSMVSFNSGNTYAEFDDSIDKVAGYGLAGLVAGGVLAKAGFFKILLASWKLIAVGAVVLFGGIGAIVKRMHGRGQAGN